MSVCLYKRAHGMISISLYLFLFWNGVDAFSILPSTSNSQRFSLSRTAGWDHGNNGYGGQLHTSNSGNSASRSSCKRSSTRRSSSNNSDVSTKKPPPPILNGKSILPLGVLQKGLQGHTVPAVYALLSSKFQKGTTGWEHVLYIGTTLDLAQELEEQQEDQQDVAFVRALSFSIPQQKAMQDMASEWRQNVLQAGGVLSKAPAVPLDVADEMLRQAQMNALRTFDDEEEDDDDDDDDYFDMMPARPLYSPTTTTPVDGIISPFAEENSSQAESRNMVFTLESVNLVLDEVRPYLVADGGNVSVDRVDPETQNVYLKLEGACGSCPSSTVTMQMGIERVLRENFPTLGQVIQIDAGVEKPSQLSLDMVLLELNRIGPAISAMGGQWELVGIDADDGRVNLTFSGPEKLRQGLELALLDVPQCQSVVFV